MSDRIAVMEDGVVKQCGSPEEIYEQPTGPFVAGFIGVSNLLPGVSRDGGVRLAPSTACAATCPADCGHGDDVQLSVRPEKIWIDHLEEGMISVERDDRRARLRGHHHAGDRRAGGGRAPRRARAEHGPRPRRRPLGDRRPRAARLAPRARAGAALMAEQEMFEAVQAALGGPGIDDQLVAVGEFYPARPHRRAVRGEACSAACGRHDRRAGGRVGLAAGSSPACGAPTRPRGCPRRCWSASRPARSTASPSPIATPEPSELASASRARLEVKVHQRVNVRVSS